MMEMNKYLSMILFPTLLMIMKPVHAQESKFKALFIYKFIDYIEWPQSTDVLTVGVFKNNEVLTALQDFTNGKDGIKVESINSSSEISAGMLYIPDVRSSDAKQIVSDLSGKPVIIITDSKDSVGESSDIGFFLKDGKLRFVISRSSIEQKNILPSSKLLSLGEVI
jgi:hypothetical protein